MKGSAVAVGERGEPFLDWLERALGQEVECVPIEPTDPERVVDLCQEVHARIAFVSFEASRPVRARLISRLVARLPGLPVVAVGDANDPSLVLAAVRAGARDVVQAGGDAADLEAVAERVQLASSAAPLASGTQITLLCARPDLDTTCLAVHLALALVEEAPEDDGVLLVDIGLPSSDSLLFLDLAPSYSVVDAVQSLQRFDQALVHTAFARHPSGLAILPLPDPPEGMEALDAGDVRDLLGVLKAFFRYTVVNLGGRRSGPFVGRLLEPSDRSLLLADQSVVSCTATRKLLDGLAEEGVSTDAFRLVVDRQTRKLEPSVEKMAEILSVPLLHTLPPHGFELLKAMNLAQSIFEMAPRSLYGASVRSLAATLAGTSGVRTEVGTASRVNAWFAGLLRRS